MYKVTKLNNFSSNNYKIECMLEITSFEKRLMEWSGILPESR